jgi:hypothetical protein
MFVELVDRNRNLNQSTIRSPASCSFKYPSKSDAGLFQTICLKADTIMGISSVMNLSVEIQDSLIIKGHFYIAVLEIDF